MQIAHDLICKMSLLERFGACIWAIVMSRDAPHKKKNPGAGNNHAFRNSPSVRILWLQSDRTTDVASNRAHHIAEGAPALVPRELAMASVVTKLASLS